MVYQEALITFCLLVSIYSAILLINQDKLKTRNTKNIHKMKREK